MTIWLQWQTPLAVGIGLLLVIFGVVFFLMGQLFDTQEESQSQTVPPGAGGVAGALDPPGGGV